MQENSYETTVEEISQGSTGFEYQIALQIIQAVGAFRRLSSLSWAPFCLDIFSKCVDRFLQQYTPH